ncbi:TetR/AcrR family transcriptional regulator [Corynebacterium sp. LK2510]|uniref:TetR/AcrR family transcriptional regulator n=1 Tax=Corynebacterium sp. LK2510 TaxID=3110472 RepID=UPI0034CEA377
MQASASTGRRAGLTQDRVIDAALSLSEEVGIDGWSIRDITKSLGVVPSVVYHYFHNKEALCDAVVDRIWASIQLPDEDKEWREWFTEMVHQIRAVLLRYYGVTDRLARGKFTEGALPVLDASYRKLEQAGFGDQIALVYTIITNSTLHAIGARNLRTTHQKGERHDLNELLDRLKPMMTRSVGLKNMVESYFEPLSHPDNESRMSDEYFDLLLKVVFDGLEQTFLRDGRNHD